MRETDGDGVVKTGFASQAELLAEGQAWLREAGRIESLAAVTFTSDFGDISIEAQRFQAGNLTLDADRSLVAPHTL
jgi:hypothetical protein